MRILIFHGYLLSGTGSNVYNASLVRALRDLGHDVHLLCQDRGAADLDFVDAIGDWDSGELRVQDTEAPTGSGSLAVYTPDIGGLLPVYVRDRYAGFEVKEFPELADSELDRYIELNAAAVRDVAARVDGIDAALANHLVMAPVILQRAGLGFALKVHGSDLTYTILPHLERFRPYAAEGATAAAGILVGSGHIGERLAQAVPDEEVAAKVRLGPPGVDTGLFAPLEPAERPARVGALAADLAALAPLAATQSSWDRDTAEAAAAVEWFAAAPGPRVIFVGKLIPAKGVDLILEAWPTVHAQNPGARLLVCGFGPEREALEGLWSDLGAGDDELAGSVAFSGRLEHDEVARVVPAAEALVFPSRLPEAFGMVAAEAAAAGVLPVSAAHSGALEVSAALAAELPAEVAPLVSFAIEDAPAAIGDRINAWLALDEPTRERARQALHDTSARLWGWEGVARGVIAASNGELDALPPVPLG